MVPKDELVPFVWRIYHDRPQVCYDLTNRLLHEMYMGEYRHAEFLPSYEKMSEKFGVSVSTVRRTVRMTNQIGATQSINGKGTRILDVSANRSQPDFKSPVIRRSLSYLVQSLELLLYTCEEVSNHFFQHLLPEEREKLIFRFEENQRSGREKLSIHTYLFFIAEYSRIQAIKQIYGTIYGLFLWGYPLKVSREVDARLRQTGADFTASMLRCMKENNPKPCGAIIKEYLKEQPDGLKYLERHGIAAEKLRISPALRLLITDE